MQGYVGALRYENRSSIRPLLWMILLLTALHALTLALPGIFKFQISYGGMSDNAIFPIFIMSMMFRAARKDTVFLTSRPIARRSVFAAILTHLAILSLSLAAALTIVQLLGYFANEILSDAAPMYYKRESDEMLWNPFRPNNALDTFWRALKLYVSAGLFAYGYACLRTRWKGWTIGLSIGLPILAFVLFALPTIQSFMIDVNALIENGDSLITMIVLPKWLNIVRNIVAWFRRYFNVIYWTAAAAMVPLSFFVMRKTRHIA
ncbi:MAG: hypothetical protein LBS72_01935 [Oscillospiraceae bacterium]|jgi:hypothetical protein|nr:hypothetical protein [Oscillospiraceae bacterium]